MSNQEKPDKPDNIAQAPQKARRPVVWPLQHADHFNLDVESPLPKRAVIETPSRDELPGLGDQLQSYVADVVQAAFKVGWAPYASRQTIPWMLTNATKDSDDVDAHEQATKLRRHGIDCDDTFRAAADIVVFGIDHGWSLSMLIALKRVVALNYQYGRPSIEVYTYKQAEGVFRAAYPTKLLEEVGTISSDFLNMNCRGSPNKQETIEYIRRLLKELASAKADADTTRIAARIILSAAELGSASSSSMGMIRAVHNMATPLFGETT